MKTFTVPRTQGTYADVLTAIGLAKLLGGLGGDTTKIRLKYIEEEAKFIITLPSQINIEAVTSLELFPYIKVKDDDAAPAGNFDYNLESKRRFESLAWKKRNKSLKWEDAPDGIHRPRTDWAIHHAIYLLVYFANSPVHKLAFHQITGSAAVYHIMKIMSEFDQEFDQHPQYSEYSKHKKTDDVIEKITALQLFNPTKGMGVWAKKTNDARLHNLSTPTHIEILKFSGWHDSAHAVEVFADEKGQRRDIKVFVIEPKDISLSDLSGVLRLLRENAVLGSKNHPMKYDILVAISLTEIMLNYNERKLLRRGRVSQIISGFYTVIFQQLGKAKSSMSQGFIALPAWVKLSGDHADEQRKTWLEVLKEHRAVIRNLDESHIEERNLLESYRDFLSGQDTRAFLEFLSDYGPHTLRLADRGKFARWMTTEHLGRVLENMGKDDIAAIIGNSGFQSVAGAIRRATRSALYAKKNDDRTYDVHYGLAQELKRSAVTKTKFMAALSAFVAEYMTENLRAADRGKRGRAAVTTEDLLEVGKLLDNNDPQMVAMLLIAYGYAKEPKEETPEPESQDENPEQTDLEELA